MGISEIINLADILWTVGGAFGTVIVTFTVQARRKLKFKKILGLKRNKMVCNISVPTYKTEILSIKRDVVVEDEVNQLLRINQALGKIGVSSEVIVNNQSGFDEIHIGGASVNAHTNRCFYKYLKNVKWQISKNREAGYKKYENRDGFNFDYILESLDGREGFLINGKFYEFIPGKKGWAIIIKIVDDKDLVAKTVHLLFGCGSNGTVGAVNYFVDNNSKIYDVHKDGEYFGIFEVDKDGVKVGNVEWLDINDIFK